MWWSEDRFEEIEKYSIRRKLEGKCERLKDVEGRMISFNIYKIVF